MAPTSSEEQEVHGLKGLVERVRLVTYEPTSLMRARNLRAYEPFVVSRQATPQADEGILRG